ncbi:M23 family metallopeptidase, partial [Chryseobacterium sp. SIMBA_028]|uniref:M23 family metallopeptidase n=1 Tax=Chryseobacterium sp. SIMBA_028 TaxID=3085771 RepID=UPI00397CE0C5
NNVNKNRFHRTLRYNNSHPKGYYHTGTDVLTSLDTELKSMLCGEVVEALDTKGDLGKIVTIKSKDKNGKFIWIGYCHLNSYSVSKGQKIK